jgi:hypothetical protein
MPFSIVPFRDWPVNRIRGVLLASCFVVVFVIATSVGLAADGSDARRGIYSTDPDHLWNRIHGALMVRTGPDGKDHGHDRLEPLLWNESRYLIEGTSGERAVTVLEEFDRDQGELLIDDCSKRAMLQRDLWLVSNWLSGVEHSSRRLEAALDKAIYRLALSAQQIANLPDNYSLAVASRKFADRFNPNQPEAPFLPPDLFRKDGPWVGIGPAEGPVAPLHLRDEGTNRFGNSVFLIFLKLPGGRQQALDFLRQLARLDSLLVPNTDEKTQRVAPFLPHPEFPSWPKGTEVALVRRALLINSELRIAASPLTESVQIRVITSKTPALTNDVLQQARSRRPSAEWQTSFEFQLRRVDLFGEVAGGLRDVSRDRDFKTGFNSHPWDEFDRKPTAGQKFLERSQPFANNRASCTTCHAFPGSFSFNSVPGFAFGVSSRADEGVSAQRLPRPIAIAEAEKNGIKWKERRPAWAAFVKRLEP